MQRNSAWRRRATGRLVLICAAATPSWAQTANSATQSISVTGHYNNAVGTSDAASQGVIEAALLKSRPAMRPGEVLEFVPGLLVTQHSGDGKANQYFLRGFNLDHGTDFATSVDGMPINMPTHAHGQGYTDLNFLLPELVQPIEYREGPYFAQSGDFASAGAADIVYQNKLDAPPGQVTLGERGFQRAVLDHSMALGEDTQVLAALELATQQRPLDRARRLAQKQCRGGLERRRSCTRLQRQADGLPRQVDQHRPSAAALD